MKENCFGGMNPRVLNWILGFALCGMPAVSYGFTIDPARCAADSVSQPDAVGRNQWFKKCRPDMYDMVFSEGDEFHMNRQTYATRLYVTFGVPSPGGGFTFPSDWHAPLTDSADCTTAPNYRPIGVCTSGCYQPDQKLEFELGLLEIKFAMDQNAKSLVTLTPDSTRDRLETKFSPIRGFLTDIRDAQQELLEIHTLGGGKLTVTLEHPLLDGTGEMRRADSLKVGDTLVRASGETDPIVSITGRSYFGKVYNLSLESTDDLENIVVAQGFLNGSLHFQNGAGVKKLNQVLFRQSVLPSELLSAN